MSHLHWHRGGLKPCVPAGLSGSPRSLPTRERGLKRLSNSRCHQLRRVAPYAGAWIETKDLAGYARDANVAPYAGAWIETGAYCNRLSIYQVAPYAGAWIETHGRVASGSTSESLPTRERGLKLMAE